MNPDSPMEPDNYQQAWQAQSSQTRVTIATDLLLKEVQRNQRDFRAVIFFRDFREVGIAFLLLPAWIFMGVKMALPWTWYLMVPALVWVAGFMLVYRMRHKQDPSKPDEPLLHCVERSLTEQEDQIWLLRNVFWWYLLPFATPMLVFTAHVSWLKSRGWLDALSDVNVFIFIFVLAIFYFTYYLNQRVVRTHYEPRRQELLALLTSLRDETTSEVSGEYPILMSAERVICSRRQLFVASLCFVAILLIGVPAILFIASTLDQGYPKKSPFAAVRWQDSQPEVQLGEEWFKLVSLDDLPAAEIVAFSRETFASRWQKRFEEDLVELLSRMGHPPQDTVKLVVQPLTTSETRTLEDVPMTRANRQAIRAAAQARERSEPEPATRSAVPIDNAEVPLTDLIPDLRKEKKLVGLAAMVMVDGQLVASAVDGERKKGSGVPLEIGDRWHLGSVTKSITATMIARLVESGKMHWSDTVGECFPDASIHEDWKPVTLKQLLTHTAGAPANFSFQVALKQPALGPECTLARREAVLKVIGKKPAYPPGEKFAYSNVGYTIAGAMAEKATGATWEDLVKREVFEPLELTGAGFGPPKSPAKTLEQPRGHRTVLGWKVSVNDEADNTPIIGPAGTVHMTLSNLCTYATEHLRGDLGEGKLLSAETYKLLHAPELDHYACGWLKNEPSAEIPHTVYWHNGSNTMWYALVAFIPEKKMVVAVTSNDGDVSKAEAAAWEVVKAQFNVGADPRRDEQPQGMRRAVPIDDAELFRTRIDEFLSAARIKSGFNGAVLVARGGQPVYQGAFGFSHLESKAPNTLDTPFRIASLSKQFTAAAIFRLESQGKLSIDDPIHRHLPEFAKLPYRDITIHHLLTHTSGLPRTPEGIFGSIRWNSMSKAATPVDDYVRLAVKMPLKFEPGADYQYSNFGYRVLAALIARITGRDYADFMEQEVFQPLGMKDTGVARVTRPPSESRIAEGLSLWRLVPGGQPRFAHGENGRNYGAGYGSGGVYSSANDLLRWDRVLAGDELLSESQKARLFQPIHGNYACGWVVKKSGLDGRLYQMHNGANEGFFSQMMRLPEDDLVIIAVGNNLKTREIDEVLEQLFRLCRSLPYQDL